MEFTSVVRNRFPPSFPDRKGRELANSCHNIHLRDRPKRELLRRRLRTGSFWSQLEPQEDSQVSTLMRAMPPKTPGVGGKAPSEAHDKNSDRADVAHGQLAAAHQRHGDRKEIVRCLI